MQTYALDATTSSAGDEVMNSQQESISDTFVRVMGEIKKMNNDVDNDNPHRYPLRKMKQSAEKIILDALQSASEIVETSRILKDEMREVKP